jgi:hypothetical protein
MKVSQTIAVSVGSVLFLGLMVLSTGLALAERGDEGGGVRLKAKMVSGTASGKAYSQELGNRIGKRTIALITAGMGDKFTGLNETRGSRFGS